MFILFISPEPGRDGLRGRRSQSALSGMAQVSQHRLSQAQSQGSRRQGQDWKVRLNSCIFICTQTTSIYILKQMNGK